MINEQEEKAEQIVSDAFDQEAYLQELVEKGVMSESGREQFRILESWAQGMAMRKVLDEQAQLQREQHKRDHREETDARSWLDNLLRWNAKSMLGNNPSNAELDSCVAFQKVAFPAMIAIGIILFIVALINIQLSSHG